MKKILSVVTLLAALSGAASAYQTGALTPYDMQPVYSVEGLYGIAQHDAPDTYGGRLSFSMYSDAASDVRHQFSLSVAGMWGSETYEVYGYEIDSDVQIIPVTVGYTANIELTDELLFTVGAKAGYAFATVDFGPYSCDADGFTYSIGAGLKYMCSDAVYVQVGYEYSETLMGGDMDYDYGQHIISVGVGCQF
jgi:opacity protein-like surface antigen